MSHAHPAGQVPARQRHGLARLGGWTPIRAAVLLLGCSAAGAAPLSWSTVANSADTMPGSSKTFNSFNQPSVNANGLVVLRGRSKGQDGQPAKGIYARDMSQPGQALTLVFDVDTTVPGPNNTSYDGQLATLTEFPAFPRIGKDSATIVTRGQSNPVWTYTDANGTETRAGTSGVYALHKGTAKAAMTQLGAAPGMGYYSVPGASAGTKFDQFPGAPAVAGDKIAFKGNFTNGTSMTGIYFRKITDSAPTAKTKVVADTTMLIPGQPVGGVTFGSTAPPSASAEDVVFLGLDNEEHPTLGGIYRAPLAAKPPLETLVTLSDPVPGEAAGTSFRQIGEALSYDGRFLGFWGAWGDEMRDILLICPTDGQPDVVAYCQATYPQGYATQVPVHQGFFVLDTQSRQLYAAAKTGATYQDFLYWTFSGKPPGKGDADAEDPEPPRWRSAAFISAFHKSGAKAQVAFKGRLATPQTVDGLYLTTVPAKNPSITTLVDTTTPARQIDPAAPAGALVSALGLEREALRGPWLAITASMLDAVTGEAWAGVYVTKTK